MRKKNYYIQWHHHQVCKILAGSAFERKNRQWLNVSKINIFTNTLYSRNNTFYFCKTKQNKTKIYIYYTIGKHACTYKSSWYKGKVFRVCFYNSTCTSLNSFAIFFHCWDCTISWNMCEICWRTSLSANDIKLVREWARRKSIEVVILQLAVLAQR